MEKPLEEENKNKEKQPQSLEIKVQSFADEKVDENPKVNVIQPEDFYSIIEVKDLEAVKKLGGLKGIYQSLASNPETGLSPETERQLKHIYESQESEFNIIPLKDPKAKLPEDFLLRYQLYGKNDLPLAPSKGIFKLIWLAMHDRLLITLMVAAIVSLAIGLYQTFTHEPAADKDGIQEIEWIDGLAIIIAVLLVVLFGSINDFQKEKQFKKLNSKKEDRLVKVVRNSKNIEISVKDILVGDIISIEPGDILPVDGILITGSNLKCDESSVTGESEPVKKFSYHDYVRIPSSNDATLLPTPSLSSLQDKSSQDKQMTLEYTLGQEVNSSEDLAQEKTPKSSVMPKGDPFLISGSKVLEGIGKFIVISVGVHSFYGHTMMSLRVEPPPTPLQQKLAKLADFIAIIGGGAGVIMLISLLIKYLVGFTVFKPPTPQIIGDVTDIVIASVTIVVVAVPEGLPLAVTLALAYATMRMLKDNNLVRVLASCETMGNATTICSDKTGTLTQNKMTVVAGNIGNTLTFPVTEENDLTVNIPIEFSQLKEKIHPKLIDLITQCITINSTATKGINIEGEDSFIGSPTEIALIQFVEKVYRQSEFDLDKIRNATTVQQVWPFSSDRKCMMTLVQCINLNGEKFYRLYVKGASEILLKDAKYLLDDERVPQMDEYSLKQNDPQYPLIEMDQVLRDHLQRFIDFYANEALRTIAIAYKDYTEDEVENTLNEEELLNDLTWVGIFGIEDPLRDGVSEAVGKCKQAGIVVRMVTGDNILTAKAIATRCGIYQSGIIMDGPTFRKLSDEQAVQVVPYLQVLARSTPEDKKKLVTYLRNLGEVVAVTGDGTNDGPALRAADVGFSMGISGTEVAKEASAIVLMDDNFSSIVKAVMWGRCVNDSIKKFLQFQLTINVTAVIIAYVTALSDEEQSSVLTPIQLLWLNLIMDTFGALALATDPASPELLNRYPEKRTAPLIDIDMIKMILGQTILQTTVTLILYYLGYAIFSLDPNSVDDTRILKTIIFNSFVFLQIFNTINCRVLGSGLNVFHRFFDNRYFLIMVFFEIVAQILIIEFGGTAFQVIPLDLKWWLVSLFIGTFVLPNGVLVRLLPTRYLSWIIPAALKESPYHVPYHPEFPPDRIHSQLRYYSTLRGSSRLTTFSSSKSMSDHLELPNFRRSTFPNLSPPVKSAGMLIPSMVASAIAVQFKPSSRYDRDEPPSEPEHPPASSHSPKPSSTL